MSYERKNNLIFLFSSNAMFLYFKLYNPPISYMFMLCYVFMPWSSKNERKFDYISGS